MVIAVNTRFLLKEYMEGYGNFIFECFSRITKKYPQHSFIYIFDRPFDEGFITSQNIIPVIAGPMARHPVLWRYWYNYKVPAVLRKYKADVFVSPDGFCSLRTNIPQCLVLHDLAFLQFPKYIKKSHFNFYKKYTPQFLHKAERIVTVSEFSKNDIIENYKTAGEKINVVYNGVSSLFKPISGQEKEIIKNKYADGKEFYLCVGSIHPRKNLLALLKAFSVFKKRQKSNMQLLIAGRLAWGYQAFIDGLKTYKYRDEVKLLGYLPQEILANITASAYALVYPSLFEGFGLPPIEAMQCGVPVVTGNLSSMPEICGNAALYADPHKYESIAEQMMFLYKDESRKKELIELGRQQAAKYNWDIAADLLWAGILKTAGKGND
jgi:glycosyltransferase involved in cell wall biosynthesis